MNNFTPHANAVIRLQLTSMPMQFGVDNRAHMHNASGHLPGDSMNFWHAGDGYAFEALPLLGKDMDEEPVIDEHVHRHQDIPDPWRCHDPFASSVDKPLKIGKHFSIPVSIPDVAGNRRKRRGTVKLQDFMHWFAEETYLQALYRINAREKQKWHKKIQRLVGNLSHDVVGQRNWRDLGGGPKEEGEGAGEDEDNEPDGGGGDGFLDQEDVGNEAPADKMADDRDLVITASQIDRMSYEDLVKKSVELFLVNSQKYAQESVLSRRMKDWEEKMGPQLTAQEERFAFDIHAYGNRIMEAFGEVMERRSFASIVQGKENHEVCHYMLASLQPANDYTVEIHRRDGLEEAIDTMELTLLTKQKAHEHFKTYTAPSISADR